MKTKIFSSASIIIFIVSLVYFLLPNEWKILYTQLFSSKERKKIILPVKSVNTDDIEDTYGAERPGGRKHEGLDIFAPYFSPVISASDGILLYTGRDVLGGNVIKILGNDKRIYYYAHLSKYIDFKTEDKIKQGQTIGYVGNTGNAISTPPHLHFEIMEIKWLLPLITKNINPYNELIDSNSFKQDLINYSN